MRQVTGNDIAVAVALVLRVGFAMGSMVLAAATLLPDDFGEFSAMLLAGQLVGVFCDGGGGLYYFRLAAIDFHRAVGCYRRELRWRTIRGGMGCTLAAIVVSGALGCDLYHSFVAILVGYLNADFELRSALLRGGQRAFGEMIGGVAQLAVFLLSSSLMVWLMGGIGSFVWAVGMLAGRASGVLVVGRFAQLGRVRARGSVGGRMAFAIDAYVGQLLFHVDSWVVLLAMGSSGYGLYSALQKTVLSVVVLAQLISSMLLPRLVCLTPEDWRRQFVRLCVSSLLMGFLAVGLVLFLSFLLLMWIYGPEYEAAWMYVLPLSVLSGLRFSSALFGICLTAMGMQANRAVGSLIALSISLILSCLMAYFCPDCMVVWAVVMGIGFLYLFYFMKMRAVIS